MKSAVPKYIEPDLKNLRTIDEVWMILEREYSDVSELTNELIRSLMNFQVSSLARTESQKFRVAQKLESSYGRLTRSQENKYA